MRPTKCKIYVFIAILSFSCMANVYSNAVADVLLKANEEYSSNNFSIAIDLYNQVLDSGYYAAELHYNLGNAYYKSDQLALAIANYERAKILKPYDEDINHNLNLARAHVVDKIDIIPEFFLKRIVRNLVNSATSNFWAIMSAGFFVVCLGLFLIFLFARRVLLKQLSFGFGITLFLLSSIAFYFSSQRKEYIINPGTAIISAPSITIKSSPNDFGTNVFILHEGTKIEIVDEVKDWKEIKTSNGNKGWIKSTDLIII